MKCKINNSIGEVVGDLEVQDSLFSVGMREDLVHQVVVAQHSNLRQGLSLIHISEPTRPY